LSWPVVSVKDICQLRYGKALKASARSDAGYPVVGSGGVVGAHAEALIGGPSIVVGRKGSIGSLTYLEEPSWPIDTTYYVTESGTEADLRWLYWALQSLGLNGMNKSAAVPGLNREDVYRLALPLPPLPEQRRITSILDQADELRRSLGVRVAILEEMQTSVFLDLASRSDARSVPLSEIATTTSGGTPSREVNENYGQGHYWVKSGEVSQDVVLTTG
jgi:type I restriction enzyme S subunit